MSSLKSGKTKDMTKQEKLEITRRNITQVLVNSTVYPFKWLRSVYRCFYCYEEFKEPKELLPHLRSHCKTEEIYVAMNNYWETVVYVDVSSITCKLCPMKIDDLKALVEHLIETHQIEIDKSIAIRMVPFKLDAPSAKCLDCGYVFRSYAHLFVHTVRMHKAYSVVHCNICGQHFKTSKDMHLHKNLTHSKKEVKCTVCGLIMPATKMKVHLQNFHGKKYDCFYCSEKFVTHYQRARHFIEVHKSRENLNCTYCPRKFVFESSLKRHVREIHLKEKDSVCDICGWEGFGKARMQRHMMKHSDERNIKCPDCDKAYKTKKTMRQHFRNMHQKTEKVKDEVLKTFIDL